MKAKVLQRIREAYGHGLIEGVILEVPAPVAPSERRIKYRLVFIVDGKRVVGHDNERGKGDHKQFGGKQQAYRFKDVPTLISDFLRDVREREA